MNRDKQKEIRKRLSELKKRSLIDNFIECNKEFEQVLKEKNKKKRCKKW